MKALALQPVSDLVRPPAAKTAPPAAILAQRHSTFGGGAVSAPPILDGGRPLDSATRGAMEASFGRPFDHVRVHDDARAHDNARGLGARAYAAGEHLVFGEGSYRPETAAGRALIAHELAHTVQQGGVQMKSEGPLPVGADRELEAQADRAAAAVVAGRPVGALSRIGAPAVFRQTDPPPVVGTSAPVAGTATPVAVAPQPALPPSFDLISPIPADPGTTSLVVRMKDPFELPLPKGKGAWVQESYDAYGKGTRLLFLPLFKGKTLETWDVVAAYKEGSEAYKTIWLNKHGFTSLASMAAAFAKAATTDQALAETVKKPTVAAILKGFQGESLKKAHCDIDHIVEKQLQGTSEPPNLQLLESTKNQASGRETYQKLVAVVETLRNSGYTQVQDLRIHFNAVKVPVDTADDGSVDIETALRTGAVKGSDAVAANVQGTPVTLLAGSQPATMNVMKTGETPVDFNFKRIIPGIRLTKYKRLPGKPADELIGVLDGKLIATTGAADENIALDAVPAAAPGTPAATPAAAGDAGAAGATPEAAPAVETRQVKLRQVSKTAKIGFYYPYLSKAWLNSLTVNDSGEAQGKGKITPSIPIFKELDIEFGKDMLKIVGNIPTEKLTTPLAGVFRFTKSDLSLALAPAFVPSGSLSFEVGPSGKPVVLGTLTAKLEQGVFVASADLMPAGKLPGIEAAAGKAEYRSDRGWSGEIKATSSSLPGSQVTVALGFRSEKGVFTPYATGEIITKVKDTELKLGAKWAGAGISYWGSASIPNPLPLVQSVKLGGSYANNTLWLEGEADIVWKKLNAKMKVYYSRKDGAEGAFSGKAEIDMATASDKASGSLKLNFFPDGGYSGEGQIKYKVTPNIQPTLGISIDRERRVKLSGEVAVGDIPLSGKWPAQGGKISLIKNAGVKITIPTPWPAVTAYLQFRGELGVGYGVGPVALKGVTFKGSLYPMEEDPKISASISGKLVAPAYGELYGTFGAYVGAEVALGAVGAKGGIDVTPKVRVDAAGVFDVNAAYEAGGFSFSAEAYVTGQVSASLKVDFRAEVYLAYGIVSYDWVYNIATFGPKELIPMLKLTLGKLSYDPTGKITWPSLSQIRMEPDSIDPLKIVADLMGNAQQVKK